MIANRGGGRGTGAKAPPARFVATDAPGDPFDADGDSVPDYIDDTNGNRIYDDSDLFDWHSYYPPNGLTAAAFLQVYTPLR